jgi:NitT/TauT family transport system permease protein
VSNSKLAIEKPIRSPNSLNFPAKRSPLVRMLRRLLMQLAPLLIILLVWEGLSGSWGKQFQLIEPGLLGKPSEIGQAFIQLITSGSIFLHIWVTVQEAIGGLLLAIVAGVTVGIALSYSRVASQIALPYIQVLNSIPRIALAPFFIIWFGIGLTSKVLLAALAAFFPIFFTTYQGLQNIQAELVDAFWVMGASQWQILRMVILPAVVIWVIAGIRTSLGMALVGALVAEYIGSNQGLGFLLMSAQGVLNVDRAWAVLIFLAAIGILLDGSLQRLESYLLRWRHSVEAD